MNEQTFRIYQMYQMGHLLALEEMNKYKLLTKEEYEEGLKLSMLYDNWIYNGVGSVEIETKYNDYVYNLVIRFVNKDLIDKI